MHPVQFMRLRRKHQVIERTMAALNWCCGMHREMSEDIANDQLMKTAMLEPGDHVGYRQCLTDAADFLGDLERLAVLWHPAINVSDLGVA